MAWPPTPPVLAGVFPGVVEFLHESVRAAVSLARNGCLQRFARIRFLLSHGGGYLPYAAMRIALMALRDLPPGDAVALLRRFFFDTALTSYDALSTLLSFADPTHVTFGTDWPYASGEQAAGFITGLDAHAMTPDQIHAIARGSAETLFPRLATHQTA